MFAFKFCLREFTGVIPTVYPAGYIQYNLFLDKPIINKTWQNQMLYLSIAIASLQFLISAMQQLPGGQLEFTLILYAVLQCLLYCPSCSY